MEDTSRKGRFFYGWVIVLTLCLIQAIVVVLTQNYASFFQVPICETLGVSYAEFSVGAIFGSVAGMIFSACMSKRMDQGNLRIWMTVCAFVAAASMFAQSFLTAIWQYYVTQFVLNFAMAGLTFLAVNTLIARWFDDKKALATAIVFGSCGVGGMIFSPVLSNMIATVGWRESYVFIAVAVAIVGVFVFLLMRGRPEDVGQTILVKRGDADENAEAAEYVVEGITRKEAMRTFSYWALLVAMFCGGMLASGIVAQLPAYAIDMQIDYAIVMVFYSLAMIFCNLIMGVVFDKVGVAKGSWFVSICLVLACVCLLLVPLFGIVPACVGAVLLGFNGAISFMAPLTNAQVFGGRFFAENFGYINVAFMMGCMCGSPLAASIRTFVGSYELAWIVMGVAAVVMLVGTLLSLSRGKAIPQQWHE